MKIVLASVLVFTAVTVFGNPSLHATGYLVKDGEARAEIIIAAEPDRLVRLGAAELQEYVEKMTGAKLPIVTEPSGDYAVRVYIGQSPYVKALGIDLEGLEPGAFRIKSGPDYLALVGADLNFVPPEPSARGTGDRDRAIAEWDRMTADLTDAAWGNPLLSVHRFYNSATDTWHYDQSGSLHAVYEFLEGEGVRWYWPGELGEVVPRKTSIALPNVDLVVEPDFPVRRYFGPAFMQMTRDDLLWGRRLRTNQGYPVLGAGSQVHGMRGIFGRSEMKEAHPEYYALYGGQRLNTPSHAHLCWTSDGVFEETVNYARAVFDLLDEPAVDLWPEDGFRMCEDEGCAGLTPSEAVFGFIDRVARELYKTHPDRLVTCGAYAAYRLPPDNVDKFPPNVVIFTAYQRPGLDQQETWGMAGATYEELFEGWASKVAPGNLITNSNHRSPTVLMTRSVVADLQNRKGRSLGDWNEVGHTQGTAIHGKLQGGRETGRQTWVLGPHHLNMYVNARYLWDADQDLDELLDEYYELFYGPAAAPVKEALEFAENQYTRGQGRAELSLEDRIELILKLNAAQKVAGDTIYAERIAYLAEPLGTLETLRKAQQARVQADQIRQEALLVMGRNRATGNDAKSYSLVDIETGEEPPYDTTFQVWWDDGDLIFDIVCQEPDMENLFVTSDIWGGDSVGVMIETPFHAYYQIEVNPDGVVFDADREHRRPNANWSSQVDVETERGKDFWRVQLRFPIMDEDTGVLDPLHNVVGEKPTLDAPWFIQVGRVRIRNLEKTAYTLIPTGGSYHDRDKFGRLAVE